MREKSDFQSSHTGSQGMESPVFGCFGVDLNWVGFGQAQQLLHSGTLYGAQERRAIFHSELVSSAYMLAAKAPRGQHRKDGSSQLSHCVMTALQLAELGLDADCVAAGLLHGELHSAAGACYVPPCPLVSLFQLDSSF